jgi:hypothetical protein
MNITQAQCVCICGLRYPAWNPHAPYCHLWPAPLYSNFPHYLTDSMILDGGGGRSLNTKCVLIFSTTFVRNISHSKKKWARYDKKIYIGLKYPLFSSDFNEIWNFPIDFQKTANIIFHENPSSGSRVVPRGRKDRRTDMTKLIVAFRNSVNAPKNESESFVWYHTAYF